MSYMRRYVGRLVGQAVRLHYGFVVLLVCMLVVTGALGLGRFAYTMILPSMQVGLGLSYTQMGMLASGNFVGYLVSALVSGVLAARYGPRRVIGAALLLTGAALLLTGLSPSFEFALAMRTLTGAGSAGAYIPAMGLISAWFASRLRGAATGFIVAGAGVGMLLSGQAVPVLLQTYGSSGWRYIWHFLGLIVLVLGLLAWRHLRNRPEEKALEPIGTDVNSSDGCIPLDPSSIWRQTLGAPVIWHLALIYVTFGFAYVVYVTFFAAYLQQQGVTARAAGDLWALVGVLSLFSGLIWGTFSDRVGRRLGLAVVLSLQALSFVLFALVQAPAGFFASAVLFGMAAWSVPAIMGASAGDYADTRLVPAALGFMGFFFGLGQALGPSIAGYIGDTTSSFALAFLLAAAVSLGGAAGSLLLRPAHELHRGKG